MNYKQTRIRLMLGEPNPFAGGQPFGEAGAYESLVGRVHFVVDPIAPAQRAIVDLDKADLNADRMVEFTSDLWILKPVELQQGNRRILFDFVNRGTKRALQMFNDAPHCNHPRTTGDAGNGFLMRKGYTLVWAAWEGDLRPGDGRMILDVPVARQEGESITGWIRSEFIADESGIYCYPLSGTVAARSYPAASMDTSNATLTRRRYATSQRIPIPPQEWQFARLEREVSNPAVVVSSDSAVIPSDTHVYLPAGFEPGWIYELVYLAKHPLVLGLGYVGVRELISFLRYAETDSNETPNPLIQGDTHIEKAYCFGRSQSGRVIRDFIYRGFNADAQGRRVFDGAFAHVAGAGRICLNHRFAQPVRLANFQHEEHFGYADNFPFSYAESTDHLTGKTDAILKRPDTDPLVIHTDSSTEYWQRHASLVHTDTQGEDLQQPDNVRLYLWSSSQHRPDPIVGKPSKSVLHQHLKNDVVITSPLFRALLDHLNHWATLGTPPPISRVPTRAEGTLVSAEDWQARFPRIPATAIPQHPNTLPLYDYGPDADKGYLTLVPLEEPPQKYPIWVPAVDVDGNEVAGIRMPLVQTPLGTYTGWNIRTRGFSPGAMASYFGSYIPFPATKDEREATADPRPSIEERYTTLEEYLAAFLRSAERLALEGFLLQEDVERIKKIDPCWPPQGTRSG